jgi:signal transduction histidine kinase
MTTPAELTSPTRRLIAGLVFTLLVIGVNAAYTLRSVHRMREMQTSIVERNRLGSLQLIRIQNDLNSLALAMRDMLDNPDGYPLSAWRSPLARVRQNLEDAIAREDALSQARRAPQQTAFLTSSFADFWRACDSMLDLADRREDARARQMVLDTLQPRQEALTALTARLLVENSEQESRASQEIAGIYTQIERNAYTFVGLSIVLIVLTSLTLILANRRLFSHLASLAEQRRELAQQLIATQESTFRSISRDLHDEFGQISTALGAMLRRAGKLAPSSEFREQVHEASVVVQGTLEKIRTLSQSLQPVILEEQGLLPAIEWHLSIFERHTGITVDYHPPEAPVTVPPESAIHVFRILQEALNNVARHASVDRVKVSLVTVPALLRLTIEDEGKAGPQPFRPGVGLAAMRERAELVHGHLQITRTGNGGTRVSLDLPRDQPSPREVSVG